MNDKMISEAVVPAKSIRKRLPLAPGQPNSISKLTDAVQEKICSLITNGARYEQACLQCNITRQTCHNWRVRGAHDPNGRYGRFLAAINTALSECEIDAAEAERRVDAINAARRLRRLKKKGQGIRADRGNQQGIGT
jgi:hypothetical protein